MVKTENRFNLIDEQWIPVVDAGYVSLKDLFSNNSYKDIGGSPIQKIALMKLLLAIAQSACTPEDNDDWTRLGASGVAEKCLPYLDIWHDKFYLYGENPFMQMPAIKSSPVQSCGESMPEISTGNTTILTQTQVEKKWSDADKALLVVQLSGFGMSGKMDTSLVLSPGYAGKRNDKGKPSTSKAGTSLGFTGYLHSFLQGSSIMETIWLNLFTKEQIKDMSIYKGGLGVAPWERMPDGEDCEIARALKNTLMGRLISLSTFCLLSEEGGIHCVEGISHLTHKEGMWDPSVSVEMPTGSSKKTPTAIWVSPEKRPWRFLTALLSFFMSGQKTTCYQLSMTIPRAYQDDANMVESIGIWSGGLRVSGKIKHFISVSDDFVSSTIRIDRNALRNGEAWIMRLQTEMTELDNLSKMIYGSVIHYFRTQGSEGKKQAAQASNHFWQFCDLHAQDLIDSCADEFGSLKIRHFFANSAYKVYDMYCARDTARQIDSWAKNRPDLRKYLGNKKEIA